GTSSSRKLSGLGSPTGRDASTMRCADAMDVSSNVFRGPRAGPRDRRRLGNPVRPRAQWHTASAGQGDPAWVGAAPIVRRLARNGNVVHVALTQAGAGNADELRLLVEFVEAARADIAHRGAQAADQLMQDVADRSLVRHLPFDALRHKLQRVLDVLL